MKLTIQLRPDTTQLEQVARQFGRPIENLDEDSAGTALPKALYPKTEAIAEREVLAANRPDFLTLSLPPLAIRLMGREFSVSDAKARSELNYQNAISFEEGVQTLTSTRGKS